MKTEEEAKRIEEFLKHFEWHEKVKAEGYLGILPSGELVDRREHPNAMPMAENSMFNIPKPKQL